MIWIYPDEKLRNPRTCIRRRKMCLYCRSKDTRSYIIIRQIHPNSRFTPSDVSFINRALMTLKKDPSILPFVKIDPHTARIFLMTDSAFVTNTDFRSQLGVMFFMMDNTKNCNIIHYSSTKSLRVTQSVLSAEIFAAAEGFVYGSIIRQFCNDIYVMTLSLDLSVDSKCL